MESQFHIIHDLTKCEIKTMPVFDEHYDENGEFIRFVEYPVVVIPMKQQKPSLLKEVDSIVCINANYDFNLFAYRRVDYVFSEEFTTSRKHKCFLGGEHYGMGEYDANKIEELWQKEDKETVHNIYVQLNRLIYKFAFGENSVFISVQDDTNAYLPEILNAFGYVDRYNNDGTYVFCSLETFEKTIFAYPSVPDNQRIRFNVRSNGEIYAKYCDYTNKEFDDKLYCLVKFSDEETEFSRQLFSLDKNTNTNTIFVLYVKTLEQYRKLKTK